MVVTSRYRVKERAYREDTLDEYKRGVECAIALMHRRLGDALTIDDLADTAFMSRYHFTRVFSKITGVSPGRFLAAVRMQEAKQLLLKVDRSVTDISLDVGYNSLGTFTRIFADFVGFPPVRFRQLSLAILGLTIDDVVQFLPPNPFRNEAQSITGELVSERPLTLVTVALFPTAIPRSRPIECNCLTDSRRFSFACCPPQGAQIFAVGLTAGATMQDAILMSDEHVSVGTGFPSHKLTLEPNLYMRQRQYVEPPVVVAFPLLIADSFMTR